jgi:hypothetical protein
VHTVFWRGSLREEEHLKEPSVDGRIILKWILEERDRGMDGIDLAEDRDRRRTLVHAVMNLLVS